MLLHLPGAVSELVNVGIGFTTTVGVIASPEHPSAVGITVKVTVTGVVPELVNEPDMFPLFGLVIPVISGWSFVQLNIVPGTTGLVERVI